MAKALRFRFRRSEGLKYISHLDVLRLFERAIKRAGLPVAYSKGFNPRQRIVFGLPMPIGLTSESEYADIEFIEDLSPEYFVENLNKSLPEDIRIIDAVEHTIKNNIMNQVTAARYDITFKIVRAVSSGEMDNLIHQMLAGEEISVVKKTKKGKRLVNIRPLIYSLSARKKDGNVFILEAFLSAGAVNNLRADLLMEAFKQETGLQADIMSIHRKALYASTFNEWKNPFEVANG